jgi:hypothetical protein
MQPFDQAMTSAAKAAPRDEEVDAGVGGTA